MASSREKAIAARVLRDAGHKPEAIMDLLHASKTTVYRWLQEQPTEAPSSNVDRLEALFSEHELDALAAWNASLALSLAARLDKIAVSEKAQDAIAMPQIAKELRAVVAEIMGVSQDDKEWLAGLLAPVRDAKDAEP